jgi:hypothetical protein
VPHVAELDAVSAPPPLHSVIRYDAKRPRTTWSGGDPALHHLRRALKGASRRRARERRGW